MNKICVYTCITGDYDHLIEITNKEEGIDYLAFTNNKNLKSNTWKVIYIEDKNLTDVQLSRKIKILGNAYTKQYAIEIWQDGNQYFKKSIHQFLKKFVYSTDASFISFKHYYRDCIYEEINACMQFKKENKETLLKLKEFYKKQKYPEHIGLIETGIIVRKNGNALVEKTMEKWFQCILNFSKRDQLCFNYCVYQTKMSVFYIDLNIWDNEWTGYKEHKNKVKKLDAYRLYLGDSTNFEIEKCFDGEYTLKNDQYTLQFKIPFATDRIEFEISELEEICISKFKLQSKNALKEDLEPLYLNAFLVEDCYMFYAKPVVLFNKKWNKGDSITITFCMKKMSEEDYKRFIKKVLEKNEDLQIENQKNMATIMKLNEELNKTLQEKENMMNSKSWKYITKIRNVYHKIKK